MAKVVKQSGYVEDGDANVQFGPVSGHGWYIDSVLIGGNESNGVAIDVLDPDDNTITTVQGPNSGNANDEYGPLAVPDGGSIQIRETGTSSNEAYYFLLGIEYRGG